jgi:hypothetical protein
MKPLWQQQQEQMRKQQEQLRRQQMGAAWLEQQKKAKAGQAQSQGVPIDRFTQIEEEIARLRQEMAAGRLSEEQFKARLRELMVQDEQGNWWMVGYETGQWYLHDGSGWVRADPPGRVAPRAASQPVARPVAPKPHRFWGIVVLVLGLALTLVAGAGAMGVALDILLPYGSSAWEFVNSTAICAIVVWLGGLILTINITRKVWRGE